MSITSAWACGTSELRPRNCLRLLSAERFCESRMREIFMSGSTRGEEVAPLGVTFSPTLPKSIPDFGRSNTKG